MTTRKFHFALLWLDTIQWVLLTTKTLTKEQAKTDWHIDEVFPWYRVVIDLWETLDSILDYIVKEYYTFQPWEREQYKEKIESYLNQGIEDLILDWPLWWRYLRTDEILDEYDIKSYYKSTWLTKEELMIKMEEWRKKWLEKVLLKTLNKLSVEPFNRDEVIKSLNWELFWLKKLEYIQDCHAKGIRRY